MSTHSRLHSTLYPGAACPARPPAQSQELALSHLLASVKWQPEASPSHTVSRLGSPLLYGINRVLAGTNWQAAFLLPSHWGLKQSVGWQGRHNLPLRGTRAVWASGRGWGDRRCTQAVPPPATGGQGHCVSPLLWEGGPACCPGALPEPQAEPQGQQSPAPTDWGGGCPADRGAVGSEDPAFAKRLLWPGKGWGRGTASPKTVQRTAGAQSAVVGDPAIAVEAREARGAG